MRILVLTALAGALCCATSSVALSAGDHATTSGVQPFIFHGGIGVIDMRANSYTYDGGSRDSELNIESTSPVLSGGILGRLGDGWTLALDGAVAMRGSSKLANYSWNPEFSPSYGADDWSDAAHVSGSRLDHYFSGSIALGHDFAMRDGLTFNVNGGFKYTDVQWSGSNGSFIYSEIGFRDESGEFTDGERLIAYRKQYPVAFAGLDMNMVRDRWTFNLSAKGGMTFSASETDSRYRPGLRYETDYDPEPVLMLGARIEYAATEKLSLFVSGTYDRVFRGRGNTTAYDIASGAIVDQYPNGGGGDFRSGTLTIGLKTAF